MSTIFNPETIESFVSRINTLQKHTEPSWGKMNTKQMLKHCIENEKLLLKDKKFKNVFIGRLFGQIALKSDTKDNSHFEKNSPTHPDLKFVDVVIKEDFESLKAEWISLLKKYPSLNNNHYDEFIHPFFRKMTKDQVGIWAKKHVDHHLRQFGV